MSENREYRRCIQLKLKQKTKTKKKKKQEIIYIEN